MTSTDVTLVVLAKAPRPGTAKTRLSPPFSLKEAAVIARAALVDTFDAVCRTRARRKVLVLSGEAGPWVPRGVDVLPQRGGGLDERLAAAFEDVAGPALLIGMDTPQVTPALLNSCIRVLLDEKHDAAIGLAEDGGFWAVGLRNPERSAFVGVPMSTATTGEHQMRRLRELGLRVGMLPSLRDVDDVEGAIAVADLAPGGAFAMAVREAMRPRATALQAP